MASESLLSNIILSKYEYALPLYRQEKMFRAMGIELPRTTMSRWMVKVGKKVEPLVELLKEEIRGGPLINIDETRLQVLNEPGRKNTSQSYIWVF